MSEIAVTDAEKSLAATDFPTFFKEVHGWRPFPWQEALLRRVLDRGWPALVDVPTGLGKTAVLDIAVFVSALRSEHARRRVFLVVDRRLIVDQAYEHAECIQQALADARPGTVCYSVARNLAAYGDDGPVLDVTRMRGGVSWSWKWLERPDRHAVVTGTVNQVGSRLLFRGYGVGERLRPIDAALVGTDSLIIVDEAHLSDAFLSTLRDIQRIETARVGPPPTIVAMSASPGEDSPDTHRVSVADEQDLIAGTRLRAPKRVHLVAVPTAKNSAGDAVADALAYWAQQLGGPGKVTGVVANTVAMARAVFNRLDAQLANPANCGLLTGRVRPVDREYLQETWYPRIQAGFARASEESLYIVATQTIEVGADIDLDDLVTESASLPAIVQRLGRVNRRGERAGSAVVVHAEALHDGVYGSARQETWQWLESIADPARHRVGRSLGDLAQGIDVSPLALRQQIRSIPVALQRAMHGAIPYTPVVSAVTLDTWTRTSPNPHPDVPVGPYLHGIGAGEPTVSVIWRADVHGDDPDQWRRSAERLPPSADEAIDLPVSAVRRWLATSPQAAAVASDTVAAHEMVMAGSALSDIESQSQPATDENISGSTIRRVLRYRGGNDYLSVVPQQIQQGDMIIVPASWGGCDRYGWNPGSIIQVTDVADLTSIRVPRRSRSTGVGSRYAAAVRVSPLLVAAISVLAPIFAGPIEQLISQISADIEGEEPNDAVYRDVLGQMLANEPETGSVSRLPHMRILRSLASFGRVTLLDDEATGDGVTALLTTSNVPWGDDASAAGTSVSADARPIALLAHQAAVRDRAAQFACNLGLPVPLRNAVLIAAAYHDEGKRDKRFQIMLHRGDQWRAMAASEPLAKSGMDPADRAALRLAHQLSGYPAGMRHEALSARIADLLIEQGADEVAITAACHRGAHFDVMAMGASAADAAEMDKELILHLVASHHGCSRPLLPPVADPDPVAIEVALDDGQHARLNSADTIDWDAPRRFAELSRCYGRWGLALLETVVRLADIWCSARAEESS